MLSRTSQRAAAIIAAAALLASIAAPAVAMAGTVKLDGSTSLQPLAQQWATAYHNSHPGTNVVVAGGGSGVGESDAAASKVDIGMSSKTAADISSKVDKQAVARDAVAVVVNPKNNVGVLTAAQILGIYRGQYKTWKQVGGKNHKGFNANHAIDLCGRTGASGTYDFFKTYMLGGKPQSGKTRAYASNGMVRSAVGRDAYAIGYVSMAYINHSVKPIKVAKKKGAAAIAPMAANVRNGKYIYWRYLWFLRKAGTSWGSEAQAFVNWCLSSAGQKIANADYLSVH